jgi:TonB family protein
MAYFPDSAPIRARRPRPGFDSRSAAKGVLALLAVLLAGAGLQWLVTSRPGTPPPPAPGSRMAVLPAEHPEPVVQPAIAAEPVLPVAKPRSEPKRVRPERRTATPPKVRVAGGPEFFESEPAVLLSVPGASYPAAARDTGTWAEVVVAVPIDASGAVGDPTIETSRVEGSAPETVFEEAAVAAARHARYTPARERGLPVGSQSTLTFTFGSAAPGP